MLRLFFPERDVTPHSDTHSFQGWCPRTLRGQQTPTLQTGVDQKLLWSVLAVGQSGISNSLRPHEPQHARPPGPSPTPGVQVMPSNHLILCHLLLLLPSIFPSIRVFSNQSVLCIRWTKYWSFSSSISPSNEYSGPISFRMDWISLQSKGLSRVFSNTTVQKHQFFGAQLSL